MGCCTDYDNHSVDSCSISDKEGHPYNLRVELSGRLGKGIGEHRKLIFVCHLYAFCGTNASDTG